MAQWTIDPRQIANGDVSDEVVMKGREAFDAGVIVRATRHVFLCPSWTDPDQAPRAAAKRWATAYTRHHRPGEPPTGWYPVTMVFAPDGWKVTCACASLTWCWHGWGCALEEEHERLARDPDFTIPEPTKPPARRRGRTTRFTVVGGNP